MRNNPDGDDHAVFLTVEQAADPHVEIDLPMTKNIIGVSKAREVLMSYTADQDHTIAWIFNRLCLRDPSRSQKQNSSCNPTPNILPAGMERRH